MCSCRHNLSFESVNFDYLISFSNYITFLSLTLSLVCLCLCLSLLSPHTQTLYFCFLHSISIFLLSLSSIYTQTQTRTLSLANFLLPCGRDGVRYRDRRVERQRRWPEAFGNTFPFRFCPLKFKFVSLN